MHDKSILNFVKCWCGGVGGEVMSGVRYLSGPERIACLPQAW